MPDLSEILQKLYAAGFELQTFERFPKAIGVTRGNCIALLEPDASSGLRVLGKAGWRLGEVIGVLTTKNGQKVFQSKDQILEATTERERELRAFEDELAVLLVPRTM